MTRARGPRKNRLAGEISPYLLQHATNPVDWYPWGPEALERARREQRPIFLSIGYSACHWCHVMERESFTDEAIARLLDQHFVSVKVDREERPDLDEIYMKAVQALSGSGGWPMTVFLTPELEPFFGGTYFPPHGMHGRPGFAQVLRAIARSWQERRESVVQQAARITEAIRRESALDARAPLEPTLLDRSLTILGQSFDPEWGGFGAPPKFPHAVDLRLLLRHWRRTGSTAALDMAVRSLDRMASGGIHDQLGGGFHRYSTDREWLIPHFEKMLYDNALLVPAYLEAHTATGEARHAAVARDCCDWVLREMRTPEGAFACAQDADSEGEEGKFFTWTPAELREVLGSPLAAWAQEWYGVTEGGNFEHGASALWRRDPADEVAQRLGIGTPELEDAMRGARSRLFEARSERVAPATDDKVLTAWNGLMISALAQAAQVLGEARYLRAAQEAMAFILEALRRPDGRLLASYRAGRAHQGAFLDDHAFLIAALLDLYETDFNERWLREALALDQVLSAHFEDPERGGYFTTPSDHEQLIARLKAPQDGALPSGNGVQALNLLRLAELTGSGARARQAERTITALGALANRYPQAFGQVLLAADFLRSGPVAIVVAGAPGTAPVEALLHGLRRRFLPHRVVALAHGAADGDLIPLLEGRSAEPGRARAYVCRNYACRLPSDSPAELAAELEEAGARGPSPA
jgi:uncharacterized protein